MAKDKSKKKDKAEEPEVVETPKGKKAKGEKPAKEKKAKAVETEEEVDEFDPVGGGDGFSIKDNVGALVFVTPTGIKKDFKTSTGIADEVIVADIVHLVPGEKPKKFEVFPDSLIFQTVLISALKEKLRSGGAVAAKITKGEAAPGKSAPYLFERNDDAKDLARAWIKVSGPDLD